ncbi:hypothetical protein F4703DRAFT_1733036 [Phycomyces blakesleeanus]
MVNAIRKTNELRIDLTTDEIVLLGEADESAGKLLQGSLLLTLAEPIKVKSICLKFSGKMKVSWSEGVGHHQHYHKQERTILQHKWQFVPVAGVAPKKTYTLAAGHHKWDFELNLPGDLPESLETEGGRVSYGLKAVIERTAFVHNMVKKRSIRIIRCMLPSEFGLSQTLEIHNTWAEKMVYDIALPSKVYANGENIPISFNILPLASQLRVRFLTAFLKEYCTYTANDYSKTDTRMVGTERTASPSQYNGYWTKVVDLKVPDASPLVFCDADNAMIRIRHKLKFVISLVNADGHYSELRCSVPIIIIDSFAQQAEISNLPAYDQSWRSVPYDPSMDMTSASPVSPVSMWWQGMDLSRVPSYRTAVQFAPANVSSSLPTYDSLETSPHPSR